jgi:hypothetical protein
MLYVPERWGALVDSQNNGLTVYVPAVAPYMLGFASPDPGPGGPTDNATNYFSAQPMLTLTPGFVFEGDLFIIAGSYVTAREIIYRLHSELAVADIFAPAGATDAPAPGSTLTGLTTVAGWSFDDVSVAKVEVLVDGVVNGTASYGLPRPDVSGDWPHAPVDCGFSYPLDSLGLTNGTHTINVRVTDSSGNIALLSDIKIAVAN